MRTLLLELSYPHRVSYYDDWREAFQRSQQFKCHTGNILTIAPANLERMLENYDVIVLLHSSNADTLDYLRPIAPILGQRRRAKLVSFIGNEFNSPHLSMTERLELLRMARNDIIASQLLPCAARYLYKRTGAHTISLPAGLNPKIFAPASGNRRRDIGCKGYHYPSFIGDDDRNRILDFVRMNAQRLGLKVEIDQNRLDRAGWAKFLQQSTGTVSSEAGSWYLAPNDELISKISEFLASRRRGLVIRNKSPARKLARRLPYPIKAALWKLLESGPIKLDVIEDPQMPFEVLHDHFFKYAARAPVYSKAIASRHLEAAGTKTALLMLRGRFNDILKAEVNYFSIEEDLSNADEVLRRFQDFKERERMIDNTYEMVMTEHTYAKRLEALYRALGA